MVMVKRENGEETVGCRYVVARPSAISSPPPYTEARIHLEAPLMIHACCVGSKAASKAKNDWSTIYNNGLYYTHEQTHTMA